MTWERAWQEGRTGWDAGVSPPALIELLARDVLPMGRALVPGCGAGYDVLTLAAAGRDATGLDLAPTARARFEELRASASVPASHARVVTADFFSWQPEDRFDLIWDYTFLCALHPTERSEWAARMRTNIRPDGQLVTLIFPATKENPRGEGPPFALRPEHLDALLTPQWDRLELAPVTRSHPGREGMEWPRVGGRARCESEFR